MFDSSALPQEYIENILNTHIGKLRYDKYTKNYIGSCPICREGKSWGKKTRFFYYPSTNRCFCFNCGYSEGILKFILDVTNKTFGEILREVKTTQYDFKEKVVEPEIIPDDLPKDPINLTDSKQIEYWNDNPHVKKCLNLIKKRKLDIAINKPKTFWFSLTDWIHKNRLILPFYDDNGKIDYFQSRKIYDSDTESPKYLGKKGDIKGLFNFDNIDERHDNLYIFEGPIDSCFVKNGVAVAGIQDNSNKMFTEKQENQIKKYPWMKKIWVLDNQITDKPACNKSKKLLKLDQHVFIWPESYKHYKDFNDICIDKGWNEIPVSFILENTFTSIRGLIKLQYMF